MLNKGLNFDTTLKQIPLIDLIVPIKDANLKIPKVRTYELREDKHLRNQNLQNQTSQKQRY